MDDVPAAADSGELIVLRVVLCAGGGKHRRQGKSPVPVPSSFRATWKEGALLKARVLEISQPPVREGGGSVGGGGATELPDQILRGCQRSRKHF